MKKKPTILINDSDMEDFIWMSYRYCIGRKTIAACTHADTIAALITDNPNLLSQERRIFMAMDIREEINNQLKWKKSVRIDGNHFRKDVFTPLLYELNKYAYKTYNVFHFNADTNNICKVVKDKTLHEFDRPDSDYNDLIPWVKLANLLDISCHRVITAVFDGKKQEIICYPFPREIRNDDGTITYKESWTGVKYGNCVSVCRYISDEYITEIKSNE